MGTVPSKFGLEDIMRRGSRNTPLWILTGAAVVVLAANFNSRNGEERTTGSPAKETAAAAPRVAMDPPAESPALNVKRLEPLLKAEPAPTKPVSTPAEDTEAMPLSTEPDGSAGMVVGIDPETGTIGMPSREFRDAMQNDPRGPAMSRSMEGLRVIHKPDGSKMVDLQGRFQEYSVVRITSDGRKEQSCVQGSGVAAALAETANEEPDADSTSNDDGATSAEPKPSDSPDR